MTSVAVLIHDLIGRAAPNRRSRFFDHRRLEAMSRDLLGVRQDVLKAWSQSGVLNSVKPDRIESLVGALKPPISFPVSLREGVIPSSAGSPGVSSQRAARASAWAQVSCATLSDLAGPIKMPKIDEAMGPVAVAQMDLGRSVLRLALLQSLIWLELGEVGFAPVAGHATDHVADHVAVARVLRLVRWALGCWAVYGFWYTPTASDVTRSDDVAGDQVAQDGAAGLRADELRAMEHWLRHANTVVSPGPAGAAARMSVLMSDHHEALQAQPKRFEGDEMPSWGAWSETPVVLREAIQFASSPAGASLARMRLALVAAFVPSVEMSLLALRVPRGILGNIQAGVGQELAST